MIAFGFALADLAPQSRAQARPRLHPRLAHVPAVGAAAPCTCHAVAEEACTATETVLPVEREPGSTAQGRQYCVGAAVPESVVSVRCDQESELGSRHGQILTTPCARLRCMGGSGAIG